MPIFVWSILVFSFMVIFAVPAITVAAGLLELDRLFGTTFYVPDPGGSALLYQHLFWFWGHPEVYILFVPAAGMVSQIIPVFSRRPLAGYLWVATSLVTIGFISFGVWVHHMFATGMPPLAMAFFSAASLDHRHPQRRPVLRVDRHDVEGGCGSPRRCCSRSVSCSSSCSAGSPA